MIYPASDTLIAKYTKQTRQVVRETAKVYSEIVKPLFLEPMDMSHCNWVQSILKCEKETELRVFENEHFMLQKDWKYSEGAMNTLYCLAIVKD